MNAKGNSVRTQALKAKWNLTRARLQKENETTFPEDAHDGEKYGLSWTKMKYE
jgi:hypothetical protein